MGRRRKARELTMQILYQIDLIEESEPEEVLATRLKEDGKRLDDEIRTYTILLVRGILQQKKSLDDLISGLSDQWDLDRMPTKDRNIIRLAAYEILYLEEIPKVVSINEAVTIAKKFSTDDSGKFVNGILDQIKKPEAKKDGSGKKA